MTYTVLDIETTGDNPRTDKLLAVGIGHEVHRPNRGRRLVREIMSDPDATIVAHTNYDLRWLMLDGATLHPGVRYHDTKVMGWMLDPTQGQLALDDLAQRHLGYTPPKVLHVSGGELMFRCASGSSVPIADAPWEEMREYNLSDIRTTGELYECLRDKLNDNGVWKHFESEEAPFSRLLVEMEVTGLPFDVEAAGQFLGELEGEWNGLRSFLVEAVGWPDFNPNSGDQVASFLYSDLWNVEQQFEIPRLVGMSKERKLEAVQSIAPPGVVVTRVGREYAYGNLVLNGRGLKPPKPKKKDAPKKRPSVSGKKLDILYGDDPWVASYIRYQRAGKMIGYLRDWIARTDGSRLHGRFDQSRTVTGRLASRGPNMQQVKSDPRVRGLFAGPLIVGDYAGLEARLAAHFSRDPVMMDIYRGGKDLYGVLAAQAWGGPESKENENRGLMKVLWLASQYGAKGETLSMTMAEAGMRGYTPRRADSLLQDLRFAVPRLFEWRDEIIAEAHAMGYITTIGGRRRVLPEIDSQEWGVMARAERQAVNSYVQGSAADIVRRAMLAARAAVEPAVASICVQVHDEIIWVRGPEWDESHFPALVEACESGHGFTLDVPLTFECTLANSWADKA